MSSVKLPRRAHNLHFIREHQNNQPYNSDDDDQEANNITDNNYNYSPRNQARRTLSCDQPEIQSSSSTTTASNNRLKHLCSRLKRRFTLTKEHRPHSEDTNESVSERRTIRFSNYKSFSSSIDDPSKEFQWPDFEKVYESIPHCLINALPGLDDLSIEENDNYPSNMYNFQTDQTDQTSIEQMNLFLECKRGKTFRRNAICHKIDKTQYHGQLDTFIQQLMIEKLMRTWT
jgi:hypothetical protein